MTTVINYNVLNFFTMKLNNIALNDNVRSYDRHLDDRRRPYPLEQDETGDVRDVTPYSTTVNDQTGKVRTKRTEKSVDFTGVSKIETLYDRKGRPVQIVHAKGLFVDAYVWSEPQKEVFMKLPEYVTVQEVRRVCRELKIRDWTKLKKPVVTPKEAKVILKEINTGKMKIAPEDFRAGLEVELEHGTRFRDANVTNNHPLLTGKIVLAHLKESLDYYIRLEVAEIEGDLLKAFVNKRPEKITKYFKKLSKAKLALSAAEARQLK